MPNVEPEVKIRLITLAEKFSEACLPSTQRGEEGLKKYLEYFDMAYKAIAKTVASE